MNNSEHEPKLTRKEERTGDTPETRKEKGTKNAEATRDSKVNYIHLVERLVICFNDCRRCHGTQQRRRHGGQSVELPDWVMNNQKATYHCSYLGHQINEATFVGGISERRPKREPRGPRKKKNDTELFV